MTIYCSYCGTYGECKPHISNGSETWCCSNCFGKKGK